MRRLPPLTALEAFVQVARLGSVKAAAEELALSTPALSRRIQALERYIGRPLFERKHQALEINADGTDLLNDIAPAIDVMSVAIEKLMSGGNQLRLRLAVMPLFASQRLLPLLGQLRQAYPLLHLDIETTPHAVIILAREVDSSLYVHELGKEYIHLFGNRDKLLEQPIERPEDLAKHILLVHREMPTIFEDWKKGIGCADFSPSAIDTYDSGPLMLEAAAQGLGIAAMLASHFSHSHDPRLVRLFHDKVESPYRYFFVCRPRALQTRPVQIFHDWLVSHSV